MTDNVIDSSTLEPEVCRVFRENESWLSDLEAMTESNSSYITLMYIINVKLH